MVSQYASVKPVPVATRGSRSGYVYVAQSPERQDACKVGHTMRPPHVRMKELGKTTWMLPVQVHAARFFWDALSVERAIHKQLSAFTLPGTEEWFGLPAWQVGGLLRELNQMCPLSGAQDWEDGLSLAEQMEWALDLVGSPDKALHKVGWRDIERLSALGHGPASWLLAEYLLASCPDEPQRALWVLDAAATQGHRYASLRRDWVASLTSPDPKRRKWKEQVNSFLNQFPDPQMWEEEDRQTLLQESLLWKRCPRMAWESPVIRDLSA